MSIEELKHAVNEVEIGRLREDRDRLKLSLESTTKQMVAEQNALADLRAALAESQAECERLRYEVEKAQRGEKAYKTLLASAMVALGDLPPMPKATSQPLLEVKLT